MNEQAIKFLENALKNNHCLIMSSVIEKFNLKDRADFDRHFNETKKRCSIYMPKRKYDYATYEKQLTNKNK